jgi:hypothetical protein
MPSIRLVIANEKRRGARMLRHLRRLCLYTFLAVILLVARNLPAAENMYIQQPTSPQIGLLPGDSPEGLSLVEQVAGAVNQRLWIRQRAFSIVLVNHTERTIVGYAVQWKFTMPDGTTQTHQYHYGQPDALLDGGKTKILPGHRFHSKMIGPSSMQIVYPLAHISQPIQLAQPLTEAAENELEHFEDLARSASQVTFSLDSVLFEDGNMLGPDSTHFLEAYTAALSGEQKAVRYIVDSAQQGVSGDEITSRVTALQEEASRNLASATLTDAQRVFNTALMSYAKEFLSVQSLSGFDAAVRVAEEHAYRSMPTVTRQNFPAK